MTGSFHRIYNRLNHLCHDFIMNLLSDDWRRRICPHAACVWTRITFKSTLMVLAGCHWQDIFTIDHTDKTGFFALQKLLNHHAATGIAKFIIRQHIVNGFMRLFDRLSNNDAFTSSKTIGFNDNRCALLIDISLCRYCVGKALISRRWDIVLFHEFFGKSL